MAKKKVRIEAPIKGVLGNQVNVGDTVMVVTKTYGSVICNRGKYLGYIESPGRYSKRAQVEIVHKATAWYKPDGTVFYGGTDYDQKTYTYITTLNLNRIATIKE